MKNSDSNEISIFTSNSHTENTSIWKQSNAGDWRLFFNIDNEYTEISNAQMNQLKILLESNRKQMKMGSLVMTPKGIGRLINLDNKIARVKFLREDVEEAFEEGLIHQEFPIYLRVLDKDFSNWYRIIVPANGNIEILKKIIEDLKIIDANNSNYSLIYNASETKDEIYFDQLELKPNSKFLLCGQKLVQCKISRYNLTYNWWYTYSTDGISFSVNKKIQMSGVGMYGSHESKIQKGTLKIFEGSITNIGSVLYEEPIEVSPAPNQNNCVMPILFSKSITIKPLIDYTIQLLSSSDYCYLYYGSGGKAQIDGEKGVEFYFKYTLGSSHGTNIESGNVPEIYYLA